MRNEICSELNVNQLKKLLQNHRTDEFDPVKIPSDLIGKLPKSNDPVEIDSSIVHQLNIPLDLDISQWKKVEAKELADQEGFEFLSNK
jgi:hypothetical protein